MERCGLPALPSEQQCCFFFCVSAKYVELVSSFIFILKFTSFVFFFFSFFDNRNEGKRNTPVLESGRVRVNQADRELKRCANTIDGSF